MRSERESVPNFRKKATRIIVGGLTAFTLARSAPIPHFESNSFSSQPGHTEHYSGDLFGSHNRRTALKQEGIAVNVHGKAVAMLSPNAIDRRGIESNRYAPHQGVRSERQHARSDARSEKQGTEYVRYGSSVSKAERTAPQGTKEEKVVVRATTVSPEEAPILTAGMRSEAALSPTFVPPGEEPMMPQTPWWAYAIYLSPDATYAVGTTINKAFIKSKRLQNKLNALEGAAIVSRALSACGPQDIATPFIETPIVAPTQAEATAIPLTETAIPYMPPTEAVTPEAGAALPDYTNYSSTGFAEPARLVWVQNPAGFGFEAAPSTMSEAAKQTFAENATNLYNQLPQADRDRTIALSCYRPDFNRNAPLLIKNGNEILWLHQGNTPSYDPFLPSFSVDTEEALTYKWVKLGSGTLVCKWDNNSEFPVIGMIANPSDAALSSIFNPGEAKFIENPNPLPQNGETKVISENGHDYRYVYNAELGMWTREVANFPLMDYPYDNFVPYGIHFAEGVPGERDVIAMTHFDDTPGYGKNASGSYDPMPIKSTLQVELQKRYFANDTRSLSDMKKQDVLYDEMLGKGEAGHEQAYLPVILSDGSEASVKLSADSGIQLTVMDKDTLMRLGEDGHGGTRVATWQVEGITFYSEVYGVDQNGNMLIRMATDGSFADLSDEGLRRVFMSFVANFAEHEDQRQQGPTQWTTALVFMSGQPQPNGTKDLEIQRVP